MLAVDKDHGSAPSGGSLALSICIRVRHGNEGPVARAHAGAGACGYPRLTGQHLVICGCLVLLPCQDGCGLRDRLRRHRVLGLHVTGVGDDELSVRVSAAGHDLPGLLERDTRVGALLRRGALGDMDGARSGFQVSCGSHEEQQRAVGGQRGLPRDEIRWQA